jgi:hypothetical protein
LELAAIVSSISGIMTKMKDIRAIAFIARYGRPLLASVHPESPVFKED